MLPSKGFSFQHVSRDEFIDSFDRTNKADAFAKTYVAKADTLKDGWSKNMGIVVDGEVYGCVLWTYSVRLPRVCNLQLLHCFADHRKCGVGEALMMYAKAQAVKDHATYFRVSSEIPAVGFYRRLGFKFWGTQKSGCFLSMFRMDSEGNPAYDLTDPAIHAAVFKKGKGGVVNLYPDGPK